MRAHTIILCALTLIIGLSWSFFLARERELFREIKRLEPRYVLAPAPLLLEGAVYRIDPSSSSLILASSDKWTLAEHPPLIEIRTDEKTHILGRIPVYEKNVIIGLEEKVLESISGIPLGSFAFISVRRRDEGHLIAGEIIFGNSLTAYQKTSLPY